MLQNAWIFPNALDLSSKSGNVSSQICPHSQLQKRFRWPLQTPHSNLNLAWPFLMPIMTHWKGQAAFELLESIQTHSVLVQEVGVWNRKCQPPMTQKSGCGDGYSQWIPILTSSNHLSYSWYKTMEGPRRCKTLESFQMLSISVQKAGMCQAKFATTHDSKNGSGDHCRHHIPI